MMKHIRSRVNGPKLKAMIINSETVQSKKMPDVAQVVFHFLLSSFQKDQISKDWIAHILMFNLCSHLFF